MNRQRVDTAGIRENLGDLNEISNSLLTDIMSKNKIIENGLKECKTCQVAINNNRKMANQSRSQNRQ